MGNQHSAADGDNRPPRPFGRSGGALGLSKSELDKRCQPSGLYDSCPWEDKAVRKLVGDGRVVARLKGSEFRTPEVNQECPICFLYYPEINVTKCCNANLCTECYLQVRPQKEKHSTCPFCNNHKLSISIAKKLTEEQIKEQEKEEQKINEARIRSKSMDKADESAPDNPKPPNNGFGSCLEQDTRVALMRARSESFASSEEGASHSEENLIQSLAMSPEERRRLEEEMKAQHSHPLALRLEAEAAERRLQNDRAYYRSNSESARARRAADLFRNSGASRRRGRGQSSRDWNQIVEAWERGGNGEVQSIDDLVVLEAAILLSMEEESRRSRDEGEEFDAARHAREGFPLVRSFLANRRDDGSTTATPEQLQTLARTLSNSRRRNQLLRASHGRARSTSSMPDTAMDTAAMLMRGISEEEQIAMAIAASLQEQQRAEGGSEEDGDSEQQSRPDPPSQNGEVRLENGETAAIGVVLEDDEDDDDDNDDDSDEILEQNVASSAALSVGEESESTDSSQNVAEGSTHGSGSGDENRSADEGVMEEGIPIEEAPATARS